MKTFSLKPQDVSRAWYVMDASEATLGRLSTQIAAMLLGKHKPTFTKHVDGGDYIIVINAALLQVTGAKRTDKLYHRHSGFPGGLSTRTLQEQLDRDPTVVIRQAVKRMLPDNKLRDSRLQRLKIYADAEHQHAAQSPVEYKFKKEVK